METVTKALALVSGGEATEIFPNGSFDLILSAPTLDRDGEVIDARAFEPLPDHIPFDIDHGMSVTTTVGSGQPYYADDGTLRVTGGFASTALAQEVRSLVTEGHIRTSSVSFMAAEREKDEKGVPHIRRAELLNGTFTPVPSNRQAVVLSSKSAEALGAKVGARNSTGDADRLQQIHDMSVANGAVCAAKSAPESELKDVTDVGVLARAVDASLDEMDDLLEGVDLTSLPAEVQQALGLAQAASTAADELLDALGESDADEDSNDNTTRSVKSTADDASATAAAAVETSDAADEGLARLALAAQALEL